MVTSIPLPGLAARPPSLEGKDPEMLAQAYSKYGTKDKNTERQPKPCGYKYDPVKDISFRIVASDRVPGPLRLNFNPLVTGLSVLLIVAFIVWCCVQPENASETFSMLKMQITHKFTWLYIGSQDVWAIFMIVLYFSKYGSLKLGRDEDEPEFPTSTWFTMLFACGLGIGLFFFGVAEPIWHYTGHNRYTDDQSLPDNTLAQIAINITFYHWGIHGWIVYSVIGALLALLSFREGLPMTMKSCFYPLIGDRIFGWLGDAIDILSILTTLFGVCTSLGLGVMQLNTGINIMNSEFEVSTSNQVILIWCITAIATVSTVSGLQVGIRRLSEICFGVGLILMTLILLLDDPFYLLNLYVQSIGFYLNWILQLGFHCDTFEMHSPALSAQDRGRAEEVVGNGGPETWMNDWTIFYWGWWIAWSPFVGIFIARISKGRTIREFINGTLTAPILYSFLWLTIFGGAGIGMERLAAHEGLCCSEQLLIPFGNVSTDSLLSLDSVDKFCQPPGCSVCSMSILSHHIDKTRESTVASIIERHDFEQRRTSDFSFVRLSCFSSEEMWFYLMLSYGALGNFLCILSMVGIVLYFITSSDSGSFIIDCLAANGCEEQPAVQRVFWALLEGASATALLLAGGDQALGALRTVSVIAGLPYTFVLCFLCVALWRACQVSAGYVDCDAANFKVSYLDFLTGSNCRLKLDWLVSFVLSPWHASRCAGRLWDYRFPYVISLAVLHYMLLLAFIVLHSVAPVLEGSWALAWVAYFSFCLLLGVIRTGVREALDYPGNPLEDFFAALICYPSVGLQLREELLEESEPTMTAAAGAESTETVFDE